MDSELPGIAVGKAEWQMIERQLLLPYNDVKLHCDGYGVILRPVMYKRQLIIQPFINEELRGAWLMNECEERRRFLRPVRSRLYSAKIWQRMVKARIKKRDEAQPVHVTYSLYWKSPRALFAHLRKHNKVIRWITDGHG